MIQALIGPIANLAGSWFENKIAKFRELPNIRHLSVPLKDTGIWHMASGIPHTAYQPYSLLKILGTVS